jgi:hypothetical protein
MSSQQSMDNTPNESVGPPTRESVPVPDQGSPPTPVRQVVPFVLLGAESERGLVDSPDGRHGRTPESAGAQGTASPSRPPSLWRNRTDCGQTH